MGYQPKLNDDKLSALTLNLPSSDQRYLSWTIRATSTIACANKRFLAHLLARLCYALVHKAISAGRCFKCQLCYPAALDFLLFAGAFFFLALAFAFVFALGFGLSVSTHLPSM